MVEWLAGKRVRGTSSERTPLGTAVGGTGVGGWVELGRSNVSAGVYDVSSLPDKRYYMILGDLQLDAGISPIDMRINADLVSNYATRASVDGATDTTATLNRNQLGNTNYAASSDSFLVGYIANRSTNEKLHFGHIVNNVAAGVAPKRTEYSAKWANTSNALNQIQISNYSGSAGNYDAGELVVLGWDPADTHTNNFWQELASVELGSANANLSSGTFTAKKYLWVQIWVKGTGAGVVPVVTFNNDTSTNYALRYSGDGAADSTLTSYTSLGNGGGVGAGQSMFRNLFIINNTSNEKLVIDHTINNNTGTGAGNAPQRFEQVNKWANTSNQITEIDVTTATSTLTAGSIIKVWGAD